MVVIGINTANTRLSTETPEFALGTLGRVNGSENIYKYIKYNPGSTPVTAVAGNMTFYYAAAGVSDGTDTTVTCFATDSQALGAGVLMAAIPNNGYGWIQVTGVATLTTALTSGAAGNALCGGAANSTLKVCALVTDFQCAVCLHAVNKQVLLTCPL